MTAHVAAGDRLRQVLASAVLLTATLGVPAALGLLVGWPLPTTLDAIGRAPAVLGQPLPSSAVVDVLAVVAWLAWLHFTTGALVEIVNATARRGRPKLRLPFGGPSHDLARTLVIAALLIGATAPFTPAAVTPAVGSTSTGSTSTGTTTGGATASWAASSGTTSDARPDFAAAASPALDGVQGSVGPLGSRTAADGATAVPAARAVPGMEGERAPLAAGSARTTAQEALEYVVAAPAAGQYDCLWDIAEEQLGDGTRWSEIYDLNVGRTQPDGQTLTDPDLIRPGWRLQLPPDAQPAQGRTPVDPPTAGGRVVVPGDTLWQIAEDELGDGARYGELAAAAATITQPDGDTLQHPDLIQPGWTIPIPGTTSAASDVPAISDMPAPDRQPDASRDSTADQPSPLPGPAVDVDEPPQSGEATQEDDRATAGEQRATAGAGSRDTAETAETVSGQAAVGAVADADAATDVDAETEVGSPGWALAGLSGAGTMLAGALLLLLGQRRGSSVATATTRPNPRRPPNAARRG